MDFPEYQTKSRKTAMYPSLGDNLPYLGLGIADEAGEVAGKVKKFIRDSHMSSIGDLTQVQKEDLKKEIGDVLWYISQIATEIGFTLEDVAQSNIDKLSSRLERGTIGGSGDER